MLDNAQSVLDWRRASASMYVMVHSTLCVVCHLDRASTLDVMCPICRSSRALLEACATLDAKLDAVAAQHADALTGGYPMTALYDLRLSRGFDAGNYANAYEATDYSTALARLSMNRSEAYVAAFTLGFFGSYELHEMGQHAEAYEQALASEHGKRCVALGYVDAPPAAKLIIEICPHEPRTSPCLADGSEVSVDPEVAGHLADCNASGDCSDACLYVIDHVGVEFRIVARTAAGEFENRLATADEKAATARAIFFDSDADFDDERVVDGYLVWDASRDS